jgi:DinB superfamily
MRGRPEKSEAAAFYWKYIDRVMFDDPMRALVQQLGEAMELCAGVSEERSMHRYEPDKWSMRQALNHITDTERAFCYRALWFGRGFAAPLESFDDKVASQGAEADCVSWDGHMEEFRQVRLATISLFRNMPEAAWTRSGVASGNLITVRALAFLCAGHAEHHLAILRERYLA